jgi:hypothetical protein
MTLDQYLESQQLELDINYSQKRGSKVFVTTELIDCITKEIKFIRVSDFHLYDQEIMNEAKKIVREKKLTQLGI